MTEEVIKQHHDSCEQKKKELAEKGFTGEWNSEPNRVNWVHAGLDCMMVRHNGHLHWCGYVGLKPGHPYHGKGYDEISDWPDVHGGLTFASECGGFICHITDDPGDKTWWLGFDCAHSGDLSPHMLTYQKEYSFTSDYETYKNLEYVKRETERLAETLSARGVQ